MATNSNIVMNQNTGSNQALGSGASSHTNNNLGDVLSQSKDAQMMTNVLKEMGIEDFEPRVINQLLEFSYRYTTNLLEDAKAFSVHAGKKTIDSEDIKLSIKSKVDYSFTTTPPRDLLMEISKSKNKHPLPQIKYHSGIRLPPDRFCLHAPNYVLKTNHMLDQSYQSYTKKQQQPAQKFGGQSQQMGQGASTSSSASFSVPPGSMPLKRARDDDDDYDN